MSGPYGEQQDRWTPDGAVEPYGQPSGTHPVQPYPQPYPAQYQQPYPPQYPQAYPQQAYGYPQPVYVQVAPPRSNGLGTAGFVLALIGILGLLLGGFTLFVFWPVVLVLLGLGLLFSFCGLFAAPRGLAIAGLVLSVLPFLYVLAVGSAFAALLR